MSSKIAIIGSRGIPAKYGGFETFAEELSTRLVHRGFQVYVSCEGGIDPKVKEYKGVNLFYFPLKPFYRIFYETIYDIYSLVKSSLMCDHIYILGYGAGFFFFIPKLFGKKLIVNVDGIEWTRDKYNKFEKTILYYSELCAVWYSDIIIADAFAIKKHIESSHDINAIFVPYGASIPQNNQWDSSKLKEICIQNEDIIKLQNKEYYLVVSRLEPENNIHTIIEGFLMANQDRKLIVVGNYLSSKYKQYIENILKKYNANDKIIFTGAIYKKDVLNMLRHNCFAYFHGHSAGGTNPSLLEIMIMKNIIVAHDNEFNREVGGDSLLYFNNIHVLKDIIEQIDKNIVEYLQLKEKAYNRVNENYSWDLVVEKYIPIFNQKV